MRQRIKVDPLTPDEAFRLKLVLENSQPIDRVIWLEQMRLMWGVDHIRKARDLKWEMEHKDISPNGSSS